MKRPLTVIIFISLIPFQALAKGIDSYLDLLDSHPKIQAILAQQQSLQHQAEGAMGLPDPTLVLGVDNVPVSDPSFDRYLPSSKVIGFSQPLPNSRGREAQRDIFSASADSTELLAEYARTRLYSLFFTRTAELHKVKLQTGYEEKKKQIIAQLQDYFEGQIVAGGAVYQKTFITEIEFADVERTLNSLLAQQRSIEADLIQLVGEVPDLDTMPVREKVWDEELMSLYPVRLAALDIDVEEARIELADSDYSPDFGFSGTYKFREDGANGSFDGDDWFSIQFRMTVPLWASKNQRPKLEAAKSRRQSKELKYREIIRRWRMETTRLMSEKEASSSNIKVLQRKQGALGRKITAMERTYSAGQTSLEPVLRAELARLTLLSQIADENQRYLALSEELNGHIITADSNK